PVLLDLYENDLDPGVHAAAGWVLRNWKQGEQLAKIDEKLATGQVEGDRAWYVNKQRLTFTIIEGPRRLMRGAERDSRQSAHRCAIGATEVTVEQFRACMPGRRVDQDVVTTLDSPVDKVSWYDAAEYCNWLSKQHEIPEGQWCYVRNKNGMLDF